MKTGPEKLIWNKTQKKTLSSSNNQAKRKGKAKMGDFLRAIKLWPTNTFFFKIVSIALGEAMKGLMITPTYATSEPAKRFRIYPWGIITWDLCLLAEEGTITGHF